MSSREEIDAVGAAGDREPQPSDGPDYHAEHAFWAARQPTSDDEREGLADAIHDYRVGSDAAWTTHVDDEGIVHSEDHGFADAILAAGFRRLSPLTREALAKIASDWLIENKTSNQRNADEQGAGIADAILSSLSMPEPAEVVGIPWASTQPVEKGAEQ